MTSHRNTSNCVGMPLIAQFVEELLYVVVVVVVVFLELGEVVVFVVLVVLPACLGNC